MNKKMLIGTTIALSMLVSGTALAASFNSPAEIVSGLTKISVDKVNEQRAAGKTYGEIAKDNEVLKQFKDEMLKYKSSIIDQRVKDGTISAKDADAFKKQIAQRITDCDGTPNPNSQGLGRKYGCGMGFGKGQGQGMGYGRGLRDGMGLGYNFNK
jgi:hypothetical protein